MLAFWCGPQPAEIDALFGESGLARDKWLERQDYRDRTIQLALEETTEFYGSGAQRRALSTATGQTANKTVSSLPEICVGARQLPAMTADALEGLGAANKPPKLFVR